MQAKLLTDYLPYYFPALRGSRRKLAEENLNKAQFTQALTLLNEKLKAAGVTLSFLCVGGGAMMLAYDARQGTHDLDGAISPADPETDELFHQLALEVARELRIDKEWINLQVRDIMLTQNVKRTNFQAVPAYTFSNLKMLFAKPGYLLSMKCQVLRIGKKDFSDIVALVKLLAIKSIAEMQAEVEKYGGWDFVGNDEVVWLKLAIAWAFPGQTPYENIRLKALEHRKR
jgi:hypothetical protein